MSKGDDSAKNQARAQLESIIEMVDALDYVVDNGGEIEIDEGWPLDEEGVRTKIQEDPLSIEVRSDWETDGSNLRAGEFRILLCTGGPAVQIVGSLGEHKEPEKARIEYQDWGTPWTEYEEMTREEETKLISYCREFYFGD